MPAETWIDFEKDILYLSLDFCYVALEGWPDIRHSYPRTRFNTGRIERKEPHGYFLNELSQDIVTVLKGLYCKSMESQRERSPKVSIYTGIKSNTIM
jgi:hypothetical protein